MVKKNSPYNQAASLPTNGSSTQPAAQKLAPKFARLDKRPKKKRKKYMTEPNVAAVCALIETHLNSWASSNGLTFTIDYSRAQGDYPVALLFMCAHDGRVVEAFATRLVDQMTRFDLWLTALVINALRGRLVMIDLSRYIMRHTAMLVAGPQILASNGLCELVPYVPLPPSDGQSVPVITNFHMDITFTMATAAKRAKGAKVSVDALCAMVELSSTTSAGHDAMDVRLHDGVGAPLFAMLIGRTPPSVPSTPNAVRPADEVSTDSGRSSPARGPPAAEANIEAVATVESDDDCVIVEEKAPHKRANVSKETAPETKKAKKMAEATVVTAPGDADNRLLRKIAPAVGDVVVELLANGQRSAVDWSQPTTQGFDERPGTSASRRATPSPLAVLPPPPPPPPEPSTSNAWDELPSNAVLDLPVYNAARIPPMIVDRNATFKWHARIDVREHDECVQRARRRGRQVQLLTAHTLAHYRGNVQDAETFNDKMCVLETLKWVATQWLHPRATMQAVGSTVNGCGAYCSDMDVCLRLPDAQRRYTTDKKFCVRQLRTFERHVRKECRAMVKSAQMIPARVPIVKLNLCGRGGESMEVDVNINNDAGIYNTHLCHHYCLVDNRFPALVLLIKHWAISSHINNSMTGTFNSYSLVLLVLHYLQAVVHPPVLPNLQAIFPRMFTMQRPVAELAHNEPFPHPPFAATELNTQPIGELVIGLFAYYSSFAWARHAISIRLGCRLNRSTMTCSTAEQHHQPVYVEEPYDHMNTARCCRVRVSSAVIYVQAEFFVPRSSAASNVPQAFTRAHETLSDGGSLADIGVDCGL